MIGDPDFETRCYRIATGVIVALATATAVLLIIGLVILP